MNKSRTLADLADSERTDYEGEMKAWKERSVTGLDPEHVVTLNRQLADQHRYGPLFSDVAEHFLSERAAPQHRESASGKWSLLKPAFSQVRMADVDERFLNTLRNTHAVGFVRAVLKSTKRKDRQQHDDKTHQAKRQRPHSQRVQGEPGVVRSPEYAALLAAWVNGTVQPHAFVSLDLPVTDINDARDHQFYLSHWTRQAEAALWGKGALHIRNYDDRVLWLVINETTELNHYHAACRFPPRQMAEERQTGTVLTTEAKCQRLQHALVQISKKTPEPYRNPLATLRGADILVKPWEPKHAKYLFKENAELFPLPHLPRKKHPTP